MEERVFFKSHSPLKQFVTLLHHLLETGFVSLPGILCSSQSWTCVSGEDEGCNDTFNDDLVYLFRMWLVIGLSNSV